MVSKRYSADRKMAVVARVLRGEPLDLIAREVNISVAKLTTWRDRALEGAASALKERERDDRDDEIARLKSKVGEITMDNELLYAKIAALEGKRPLVRRRSKR
jgi:transposase-like protein